jgi:energy-coupling factor transporter ATP-binding protein EcfA2
MLTKLTIRNFKRFEQVEIELGNPVVFIGPNNSGKTTALQALALWEIGLKKWLEKRRGKTPEKRPGVTINRRDLIAVPVPDANLLWRGLHVRDVQNIGGKPHTRNIRVDVVVEGVTEGRAWMCGLEFDYANEESFYCRPLRTSESNNPERMQIPDAASAVRMAFLPPMSGLTASETRLDPGAINVRLGEGRTAEVLRNLCYQISTSEHGRGRWEDVCRRIQGLFGVSLDEPQYIQERGEIEMTYRDPSGTRLDLSSAGGGLQQTLLLLAHLTNNPRTVLLLDEPDAHLEILRQRHIYELLSTMAQEQNSQVIAASHSEVILNEAADRDVVVAFLGKPHRIDDRGSQLLKSLKDIGFDQYYQAEQTGWVLYLEGATDLAILRAFAETLEHPVRSKLERPFVHYVQNRPNRARDHFYGLREAKGDLLGFALFDHIDQALQDRAELRERMWTRREIENYLCRADVLRAWAEATGREREGGPLFAEPWIKTMDESIQEIESALRTLGKGSPWTADLKVSDEFLQPLFDSFFKRLGLPNLLRKTDYHVLARFVKRDEIDREVHEILNSVLQIAEHARPAPEE